MVPSGKNYTLNGTAIMAMLCQKKGSPFKRPLGKRLYIKGQHLEVGLELKCLDVILYY